MDLSRRGFLESILLAAGAAATASACIKRDKPIDSFVPGGKLRVAVIGAGGFGRHHIRAIKHRDDCELVTVCDVDQARTEAALHSEFHWWNRPAYVQDMRRVFDDRSIDAVVIATPHHWHALAAVWAMQAGKDVYVEKPVSHTVSEGQYIIAAARKYGRICQAGTQRRSHGSIGAAVEFIRAGKLGDVKLAHCLAFKQRKSIGAATATQIPAGVDYDLWCGPAAKAPLTRAKFHYDWHWFWEYGNGAVGNNGIHRVDVARWGMGLGNIGSAVTSYGGRLGYSDAGETPNTQVIVHEFGDRAIVQQVRGLHTDAYRGYPDGVVFFGTQGVIGYTKNTATLFDAQGTKQHTFVGPEHDHFGNFLRAVRSRQKADLHADIAEGHLSSALCHLGNISYRVGQPLLGAELEAHMKTLSAHDDDVFGTWADTKAHLAAQGVDVGVTPLHIGPRLTIDAASETLLNNTDASALLTSSYRAPFTMPAI